MAYYALEEFLCLLFNGNLALDSALGVGGVQCDTFGNLKGIECFERVTFGRFAGVNG